jgi:hypothetical protein
MPPRKRPRKVPKKRAGGRKAEVLKIDGDWKDAVSEALKRGKPPDEAPVKKNKSK